MKKKLINPLHFFQEQQISENDILKLWLVTDENTSMNYDEKMNVYFNVLANRMEDKDWSVKAVEDSFEFVYDNRCIIHGFIDRIDENIHGDLKVIDYKS